MSEQEKGLSALGHDLRRWLASGLCQGESGAFYAWYDAATGMPSFEYPEITGYTLTHFAGRLDPTDAEIVAGRRAADWLLNRFSCQDFSARGDWDSAAIYNFDLGMAASGLIAFGQCVNDRRYIAQGLSLVGELREQLHSDAGLTTLSTRHPLASARSAWSTRGQAHLIKVVQCFLAAESLGMSGAGASADLLVAQRTGYQRENGRFITHPHDEETMLHPHLYAIEGLWMHGMAHNDGDALAHARRGTEWAWAHQLPSGGFPRHVRPAVEGEPAIEQCDVTSQAIRMALALCPDLPGIAAALARLQQIAVNTDHGAALVYQPTAPQRHYNTWVTLFGAQAAEMAADGAAALTWQKLI